MPLLREVATLVALCAIELAGNKRRSQQKDMVSLAREPATSVCASGLQLE